MAETISEHRVSIARLILVPALICRGLIAGIAGAIAGRRRPNVQAASGAGA